LKQEEMVGLDNVVSSTLSVFEGKNFDDWRVKMIVIFGFQDVGKVKVGFHELGIYATPNRRQIIKNSRNLIARPNS